MFELSPEQLEYVNARGRTVLNAGPGSGKTQTIAHKLHELISGGLGRGTSGIACLSFTNVAKDEIKSKYEELAGRKVQFPSVVSTIDSFVNMYITLPFCYLVKIASRPQILESPKELDRRLANYGKLSHKGKDNKLLKFKRNYSPSQVYKALDGSYTVNGGVEPSVVETPVFNDYAKVISDWKADVGLLTNYDSTLVALNLLKNYPDRIGKCLAQRFSYFIIDEAQDTSEIQHAIFDQLIAIGLANIDFVGDPYQTLYEWRDATPELFREKYMAVGWQGLDLVDNWRSHSPIIKCFSKLRLTTDPELICKQESSSALPVHIIKFPKDNEVSAVAKYQILAQNFEDNQVVTRGKDLAQKLSGFPSDTKDYWKSDVVKDIISCVRFYQEKKIKKAVDDLRGIIVGLENPSAKSYEINKLLKDSKYDHQRNAKLLKVLSDLSNFDDTLKVWKDKAVLGINSVLIDSVTWDCEFKARVGTGTDIETKANFEACSMKDKLSASLNPFPFPITTIHQVKGKTLDSILLIFKSYSLPLSAYKLPSSNLNENQTMIYVAMSRPRYLLALGVEDSVRDAQIKSIFGSDCVIV